MSEDLINQIADSVLTGSCPVPTSSPLEKTRIATRRQAVANSTNLVNPSQVPSWSLSDLGKQAKGDLEVLVATGKTKEFLGRLFTFNDIDNMPEKDLLKYHRIYQSALAVRVNDTFSKTALKTYSTLVSWLLPIGDKDKLYNDLRSDYILMNELDRWTGWLSLRMGGLMAVATTSLLTVSNCDFNENLKHLNGRGSVSNKPRERRQSF